MKINGKLTISNNGLNARAMGATIYSGITKKWFLKNFYDIDIETQNEIEKHVDIMKLKVNEIKALASLSWGGEWHHSTEYAVKVPYYWTHEIVNYIIENPEMWKENVYLHLEQEAKKNEKEEILVEGRYKLWTNDRKGKFLGYVEFDGTLKGDYIIITKKDGTTYKKKANGNHIEFVSVREMEPNLQKQFEEIIEENQKNGNDSFGYLEKEQIRYGLENGVDVSVYAKPEYYWRQMRQIRYGLESQLDVSAYAKPEFNWEQMREIREEMIEGKEKNKENGYER